MLAATAAEILDMFGFGGGGVFADRRTGWFTERLGRIHVPARHGVMSNLNLDTRKGARNYVSATELNHSGQSSDNRNESLVGILTFEISIG